MPRPIGRGILLCQMMICRCYVWLAHGLDTTLLAIRLLGDKKKTNVWCDLSFPFPLK